MWLFILFVAIPIIEIGLFIQIGGAIGIWSTLLIVVLTAIAGTYLVRQQGASALRDIQMSFSNLNDPGTSLAHGAMILIAGVLMLTPGFFTDTIGFLFLIPKFRDKMLKLAQQHIKNVKLHTHTNFTHNNTGTSTSQSDTTIDGEWKEVEVNKSLDKNE